MKKKHAAALELKTQVDDHKNDETASKPFKTQILWWRRRVSSWTVLRC